MKINVVDIFYHIRQVAARVAKLVLGCIWDPYFGEMEVIGVSDGTIRKNDNGSNRLSIVTIALLYVFVGNLSSNVSDAQINLGWVPLGKIWGGRGWPM